MDIRDKNIVYKRIEGLITEYIGGRRKGITLNHIKGQVNSALSHGILNKEEIKNMIDQIEAKVDSGYLFPYGPASKRRNERTDKKGKEYLRTLIRFLYFFSPLHLLWQK